MTRADLTVLNKSEEEKVMRCIFDFVCRVSSPESKSTPEEIEILPDMTKLILENFVKHYLPSTE